MIKQKLLIASLAVLLSAANDGCEADVEDHSNTHDENMEWLQTEDNDINIPSLSQTISIPGESFTLKCKYDTGKYPLDSWKITDSKEINMTVYTENLPEGYEVFIDHVHADISLYGNSGRYNGIKQDTMDDSFHGYDQPGFYIDNDTQYNNIFSIEGYTNEFVKLVGSYTYAYGYTSYSSDEVRVTESKLIDWGVIAEKLTIVYDISIKGPDDEYYHTVSSSSEMLIPVSGANKSN